MHQGLKASPHNHWVFADSEDAQPLNKAGERADDANASEDAREMFEKLGVQASINDRLPIEVHLCGRSCSVLDDDQLAIFELFIRMQRFPIFFPQVRQMTVAGKHLPEAFHAFLRLELNNISLNFAVNPAQPYPPHHPGHKEQAKKSHQ
jgi:hypothetical protein